MQIRPATAEDLPAINDIYSEAVTNSTASFDLVPPGLADRRKWFAEHGSLHPVLVAEVAGEVVDWAALSRWNRKPAYDRTAEDSVYVAHTHRGQGMGRALLEAVLAAGATAGLHAVVALIAGGNAASIRLHESLGFERVGTMREVGVKFGEYHDVHILQKLFDGPPAG